MKLGPRCAVQPRQVFTDIAGLSHAVTPGSDASVQFTFEGADLFEMEDQRQWLDGTSNGAFSGAEKVRGGAEAGAALTVVSLIAQVATRRTSDRSGRYRYRTLLCKVRR